jgi:hypothetical protein
LNERLLCDSHLIPKATFKALRDPMDSNPNPVLIGDYGAYKSSKRVSDYLLCECCEDRFRTRGENWVLANCYHPDGTFPLRSVLFSTSPHWNLDGTLIYKTSAIPELNGTKLVYFAMSVFWRAGAHWWPWEGEYVNLQLGPYLEPIRLFLLDQEPFPDQMALAARISGLKKVLELTQLPQARNRQGYYLHSFTIPGLAFFLSVGSRLPSNFLKISTAPAPEQFVAFCPNAELDEMMDLADVMQSVPPPKGYKGP